MKRFLSVMACAVVLIACAVAAQAATITIDISPATPSITADDGQGATYAATIWSTANAGNDKILIPASLAAHKFIITGTSPTTTRHIDIQGPGAGDPNGSPAFPTADFNITVKDLTMEVTKNDPQRIGGGFNTNEITGIVIRNNARVDMYVVGALSITRRDGDNGQNTGLLHVGENNGGNPQAGTGMKGHNYLYLHGDGRDKSHVILNVTGIEGMSAPNCDALRVNRNDEVYMKDITVTAERVANTSRGFALNNFATEGRTNTFENCYLELLSGRPLAAYPPVGGVTTPGPNLHFINSEIKLVGTHETESPIYVPTGTITFCDTRENSAIINNSTTPAPTINAKEILVAGGAIMITNQTPPTSTKASLGIMTNAINFVKQDAWNHPDEGKNQDIIFYVDKTGTTEGPGYAAPNVTVEKGVKAIVSEATTTSTDPKYQQTKEKYKPGNSDGVGFDKTGNVWGEFELFNARKDNNDNGGKDYVIHDKEQIIVQYDENDPNTIKIAPDALLVIEKGGRLVIEPGPDGPANNINNGVIELTDDTLTKDQIVGIIKDWSFTGTGVIKTPIGTFDNSGAMWGDIVDNSPEDLQNKLTGGPQLVVIGKDDGGDSTLVAVDPSTSDDAYLVKPNKELDLKLLVIDPADKKKLSNSHEPVETPPGSGVYNSHWMSTLIYPLKSDGGVWGVDEPGAPTPVMAPTTPVRIENSTANFQLDRDSIRTLREYAKTQGVDSFVIWVYETDGKLTTDPKSGGIRKPFVFRIDEPEHMFSEIIENNSEAKERVVAGDNLVVFGMEPVAGGTDDPKFVSMNPTRSDPVYGVPHGTGLALDLYITKNAKSAEIDRKSPEYEGTYVKASIRPYDGLTPEQYRGLADFIAALDRGPHKITNGFVDFDYAYADLHRWARLHRLNEFVVYIYDTDEHGNMKAEKVAREFVFRLTDADVSVHGQHCSGCDAGTGAGLFALAALAAYMARRRKAQR